MRLNDFYRCIGMGGIVENRRKLNKVLRLAAFSPDFMFERQKDKKGRIFFERFKYLGSGFGVIVAGFRRTRINKDGNKVEKHIVMDWGVFALGHEDSIIHSAYIDTDDVGNALCFVEDAESSNAFEFRITNAMELLDHYRTFPSQSEVDAFEHSLSKVNVALLLIYGTVLLPVVKNEESLDVRHQEESLQKELKARARQGDEWAEHSLYQMAIEQEIDLHERLLHEDLLSVFEGYFLNLAGQSGIFSVLAEILEVEELVNEASEERLYRLQTSITGTLITCYISEKDLTGAPFPGMRIMGIGLLQGKVAISNKQ